MSRGRSSFASIVGLLAVPAAHAAVSPIQAGFGNVFPTLSEQSLTVARGSGAAPWYVSFNLLAQSDVKVGALGLGAGSSGSFFELTSSRIVDIDGNNVAFGSDSFPSSPFTNPIESLAVANLLPAGQYAVEVSGTGDRVSCTPFCSDAADFVVRIQVTPNGAASTLVADTVVAPIRADYGNAFPTTTNRSISVARAGSGPQYVSFNLLARANVRLGALGLGAGSSGSFYDLTSIRLVDMDGHNVQFGTDTFPENPFPAPIEALVTANSLPAGQYALEISGAGDRVSCTPFCSDAADFVVRLQVTPVPEPSAYLLMLGGLGLVGLALRRRKEA